MNREVLKAHFEPSVSIVIAAYNEEKCIEETIQNKLALDYPPEKKEIIVVSDASTDATDSVVMKHQQNGVKLIRQEVRAGKTAALNRAVEEATGSVIVFSDANSLYSPDALHYLLRNFADPSVGYVTGKMVYVNSDGSLSGEGCSAYMKYENILRSLEMKVHSIVGVDGGVDAVRKELYRPMNHDQLPDFVLPLRIVEQGYRVVYEPEALLKEKTLKEGADEYRMRVRVSLRALWAMWDMRGMFNLIRYGVFSWQLLSHKLLRYLAVLCLIALFVSNLQLYRQGPLYGALLAGQVIFYLAALFAALSQRACAKVKMLYIPYYFTLINLASGHSLLKFLLGHKQVLWTPRKG